MSFLPAVRRVVGKCQPDDPIRLTLELLMRRAVGRNNPLTLDSIVDHLNAKGCNMTKTGFQHTVLAASRDADYFIGSGHRGYYLIDTEADAKEMRDFYETRIRAEQQNLDNLKRQSQIVGWNI